MDNCIHETVCKRQPENPCSIIEFCKYAEFRKPKEKRTYKKRGPKIKKTPGKFDPDNPADIKRIKSLLKDRRRAGALNENQLAAIKASRGISNKNLDRTRAQQLIDIYYDSFKKDN